MNTIFFNLILIVAILLLLSLIFPYFCTNTTNLFLISNSTNRSLYMPELTLIPPFLPFRSTFVRSLKYGLAACRIQKNLSTILLNIFCYLNTPRKFNRTAQFSLTTQFGNHLSIETCNSTHASHIADDEPLTTKIAIIRDPVERFLSAFVDKCIHEAQKKNHRCYGCNGDLLCVLEKQYARFQLISNGKLSNYSYEDRHFAPMTWFCDFNSETIKHFKFLYFGETEKEQEQTIINLIDIFNENGVENQTTSFILETLTSSRTKHTTSGSKIREQVGSVMRENKEAMNWLYLIYQNDYTVLNLKAPF